MGIGVGCEAPTSRCIGNHDRHMFRSGVDNQARPHERYRRPSRLACGWPSWPAARSPEFLPSFRTLVSPFKG